LLSFLPVELYANIHSITKALAPALVSVIMIMTLLGAVILGHMSRAQIRRSGYIRSGYATGSTGMTLGCLYLAALSYFLFAVMKRPLP
jgi:hypothetical protein